MTGKHLLDSNIIVADFKNDETIQSRLDDLEEVFVPAIAIGECITVQKNRQRSKKT